MKSICILCSLFLLATGCGGSSTPITSAQEQENSLQHVGEMVRNFQMSKNKPPTKFSDFTSVRAVAGNGFEAVRSGMVVLRYGAMLSDTKEEPGQTPSDELLAYESQVPEKGGRVLMLDRTIKTMTPEEFKVAKLAGKSASDTSDSKTKS